MSSSSYDLIVLGNDFAGVVTASLCASRGMRVLLAEIGKPQDLYRLTTGSGASEPFPTQPLFLTGLESPAYQRVFDELHLQHLLKRKIETIDPPCQALAPDLRLEIEADPIRFERSVLREFGSPQPWTNLVDGSLDAFGAILLGEICLPANGFWERRELGKIGAEFFAHQSRLHEVELSQEASELASITRYALASGSADFSQTDALIFAAARRSVARIQGDWNSWRTIFLDKFKSHGGEVRRVVPQQLIVRWGKVIGLQALDGEISCDQLVAAMPVAQVCKLIEKPPKRLLEMVDKTHPAGFRYTLNLVVHMSGVPEGMSKVAWSLLDPTAPPTGGNFASFSVRPSSQAGRAVVTLEGIAGVDESGAPVLEGMHDGLLDHAMQVMPFLERHLEEADSPNEVSDNKRDLKGPVPPSPLWAGVSQDDLLGMPCTAYQVGLKHLSVASSQSLPALGLEGQMIAGWSAAKISAASMGKRKVSGAAVGNL